MKRVMAVLCLLGAAAYFSPRAQAQDWDSNCPRTLWAPNYGTWAVLENEWLDNGVWIGLYLTDPEPGPPVLFQLTCGDDV